jgi:hypothetical protein
MQIDMHMYGVYALARAAGVNDRTARTVAISSQYVDDSVKDEEVVVSDRYALLPTMTSHKPIDYQNALKGDQWKVWLPFHFLPGNEPEDGSYLQRLVCRKNSAVAQKMIQDALDEKNRDLWPYLIGITAHVYADTFSHHGFIGISTNLNKVDDVNALNVRYENILETLTAKLIEIGSRASGVVPVGHGTAGTYPDMPFLSWEMEYESPIIAKGKVKRDNAGDFLDACRELHRFFGRYADQSPDIADKKSKRKWREIEPRVREIIETQENDPAELKALWKNAINDGVLFDPTKLDQGIEYDNYRWDLEQLKNTNTLQEKASQSHACKFCRASHYHRFYVLHHLLPHFGILAG